MRYVILILLTLTVQSISAQLKELTLEDAVLRQFTELAPERLNNPQWIPGEPTFAYLSPEGDALVRRAVRQDAIGNIASLAELNRGLSLDLKRMPGINWLDNHRFWFRSGQAYYLWDTAEQKGEKIADLPKGAANADLNMPSRFLAYTRENNLYITHPKIGKLEVTQHSDKNIVSGQAIARYEFGITKGTFWSPLGKFLAFYEKDETDVGDYPLLDISTSPASLRMIKYPMAGQKSEYARVGVYEVDEQRLTYLQVPGPKDQYLTNLAWDPNEDYVYITVVNRDQNHIWLHKYDAITGKLVKIILEEEHPKYVEPEKPLWFIPGKEKQFLWYSERDGYMHLYRYTSDGRLLNQVTKGRWVVDEILGLDPKGKNVLLTGWDESGLNHFAYRAPLNSTKAEKITNAQGIHRYQISTDGKYLLDQFSNMKVAYQADIIDLKGETVSKIKTSREPLDDYAIGKTELVKLKADDGTPLHARIIKPSDFDPSKKYPVLVYVYGGPHLQLVNNGRLAGARLWMHYLAEQGFIVFSLDNRGSAHRGFAFESAIHRQLGTLEIADQLVGVEYLKKQPWVDAQRMAVHGWSYGGFMTSSLMLRTPGTFQAGVAGGPVTDWKYYEVMYGERYMDRPEENPDGYKTARLMEYVDQLEGYLLLIHGNIDDVVVMQHNLSLIEAFVDAGVQVDFFVYPNHPHNVRGKDRVHLMRKVLDYVMEKLGVRE
jgi:dipeptidyl-peptidase-4